MPINTDLLIAAAMLQDSFVDKNGQPMSAGVITCYQDNSRTTLKNWYYQSGLPGNYTYLSLIHIYKVLKEWRIKANKQVKVWLI